MWGLLGSLFGGGAAAGAAGAGAAGGSGLFGGLLSSILGGGMSGGGAGAPAPPSIQMPYRAGMQPGAGGAAASGGNLWDKRGTFMGGSEGGGPSPASAAADLVGSLGASPVGSMRSFQHPVPGGSPNTNPGLFGLNELTAAAGRGGWGRGR